MIMKRNHVFWSLFFSCFCFIYAAAQTTPQMPPAAENISIRQQQQAFYRQFNLSTEEQYDSLYLALYGWAGKAAPNLQNKEQQAQKSGSENCTLNRQVYGWHPYWIGSSTFNNYDFSLISTLSYFSYEVNPTSGSYNDIHAWKTTNVINLAKAAGAKVDLCVTNFGATNNTTFLNNPAAWQRLADSLVVLLNLRNADGVNIDFEGVPGSQRTNFTNFITYLKNRFATNRPGTTISIALYAVDWTNVFDIPALQPLVNTFIIMGYDYHYSADAQAGPVAPLYHGTRWGTYTLSRSIDYYLTQGVPAYKLLLGVPYYGYDWKTNSTAIPSATVGTGASRTYSQLRTDFLNTYTRQWDQHSFTPYFSYTASGSTRQCWFDDEQSLAFKYDMVLSKQMGGIGIWALGYDNGYNELWDLIEQKFTDCNTPCSGIIYDSGGPIGNYRNNENSVFTLAAPDAEEQITLTFTTFDVEANYDYVRIYDGPGIGSPLLGTFTGSSNPGTFTSSGNVLTIQFTSDGATVKSGFEIQWYCGCVHQTAILPLAPQYTGSFTVQFNDTDNCNAAPAHGFYLPQQSWGGEWRSNAQLGFFTDEFNAAALHPDWTNAAGSWQIASGGVYQSAQSANNTNLYTSLQQSGADVWLYHWRAKTDGSADFSRRSGLHFFANNGSAENRGNSYFVFARIDDNRAQIYKTVNDVFELKTNATFTFAPNEWYDYKVIYQPATGKIDFYVNNQLAASWTDPEPYTAGQFISLRTGNSQTTYDFVRVYKKRNASAAVTVGNGNGFMVQSSAHQCRILSVVNYTDNRWSNLATAQTGIAFMVNTPTAAQPDELLSVAVLPNPVVNMANIVFTAPHTAQARLLLFDLSGSLVYQEQFACHQGANQIPINIAHLPPAMYLLHIETPQGALQQKLVKIQ